MGLILKHLIVRSTRSNYELPSNPNEVIPLGEINYKVAKIEQLSMYMDLFDLDEELNYEKMISKKAIEEVNKNKNAEFRLFLKEELNFYYYCKSELIVHSQKNNAHEYLLYQMNSSTCLSLNNNLNNQKPILFMNTEISQILLKISFNQIRVLLKFSAYINLNTLYQNGISSQYFKEKLSISDKKTYVDGYKNYFKDKYINNQSKLLFPQNLKNIEEHINYKEARKLRSYAIKKIKFERKLEEIEQELKEENDNIIKNNNKINKLKIEKAKILKNQRIFFSKMFTDKKTFEFKEYDEYDGDDTHVILHLNFKVLLTSLSLYETEQRSLEGIWKYEGEVMTFSIQNLFMELRILKISMMFLFTLENIVVTDDRIKNLNYNKIMFGDLLSKDKLLGMILEINPKLEKSNLRLKLWSERQMYVILIFILINNFS